MSKWVVDIHGDIEGDYEIIKKYEEPKTGHWIEPEDKPIGEGYCSICGYHPKIYPIVFKYCPNCGAKMEVEE